MNNPSTYGYQENAVAPLGPGQAAPGGPVSMAQYKFSADEMEVLQECNRESFFQRSLPTSSVLGLGTFAAVQSGYLKPNPRFGAFPKVTLAVALGYFIGKLSYQQACAEKLMALPGSYIGQLLKDRRDGKNVGKPVTNQAPGSMLGAGPDDIYSDAGPGSALNLDTERPAFSEEAYQPNQDLNPSGKAQQPAAPPTRSYDELRRLNRGEFADSKQDPYRVEPSRAQPALPAPPMARAPSNTNRDMGLLRADGGTKDTKKGATSSDFKPTPPAFTDADRLAGNYPPYYHLDFYDPACYSQVAPASEAQVAPASEIQVAPASEFHGADQNVSDIQGADVSVSEGAAASGSQGVATSAAASDEAGGSNRRSRKRGAARSSRSRIEKSVNKRLGSILGAALSTSQYLVVPSSSDQYSLPVADNTSGPYTGHASVPPPDRSLNLCVLYKHEYPCGHIRFEPLSPTLSFGQIRFEMPGPAQQPAQAAPSHAFMPPAQTHQAAPAAPSHAFMPPAQTHQAAPAAPSHAFMPPAQTHQAAQAAPSHAFMPPAQTHQAAQAAPSHAFMPPAQTHQAAPAAPSHAFMPPAQTHQAAPAAPSHAFMPPAPTHQAAPAAPSHAFMPPAPTHQAAPAAPSHAFMPPAPTHQAAPAAPTQAFIPPASTYQAALTAQTYPFASTAPTYPFAPAGPTYPFMPIALRYPNVPTALTYPFAPAAPTFPVVPAPMYPFGLFHQN